MILTLAMDWAGQGVIFAQVAHGAGRHKGDVDPAVYMIGMKLNFISQPIFLIAICVVKLSVGCALLRISSTKFYRTLILSIMCFMSFYTIGCFFVSYSLYIPSWVLQLLTCSLIDRHLSVYRHPCSLGPHRRRNLLVTENITEPVIHELCFQYFDRSSLCNHHSNSYALEAQRSFPNKNDAPCYFESRCLCLRSRFCQVRLCH